MKGILILLLTCLCSILTSAQWSKKDSFTMKRGLPSDWVYKCVEDNQGFLWIATDAGIARLDGKNCVQYGNKEGLPDIEVLQLVKEKCGRIWMIGQNNSVAYFDAVKNKFVDVSKVLLWLGIKGQKKFIELQEDGICLQSETGTSFFRNQQFVHYSLMPSIPKNYVLTERKDGVVVRYAVEQERENVERIYLYATKGNQIIQKKKTKITGANFECAWHDNQLYVFQRKQRKYAILSNFTFALDSLTTQTRILQDAYYMHNFCGEYLAMMHRIADLKLGKDIMEVKVYNVKQGHFLFSIRDAFIAFHLYRDKQGSFWVSTIDKGLYRYDAPTAVGDYLPSRFQPVAYYGLARDEEGKIYMGNERGEILVKSKTDWSVHLIQQGNKIEWQRNIICHGNDVYTFSDGGICKNYVYPLIDSLRKTTLDSKVVLQCNDTTILSGSLSSLHKIHMPTNSVYPLRANNFPIYAMAKLSDTLALVSSANNIYTYNVLSDSLMPFYLKDGNAIQDRVAAILVTPDTLVWIATATNGIYVIKNGVIIRRVNEEDGLRTNNMLAICSGKENEVWVGTNLGVSKIQYSSTQKIKVNIQNISLLDGLRDNTVHQLLFFNDTLLVATNKGVSFIPPEVPISPTSIYLQRIRINQQDTILVTSFDLKPNQRNIQLQFAGVNLLGYYDHAEYSLDEGKQWVPLESSNLSVEFESGDHPIFVRAVDVNKHRNSNLLRLQINIATPFYKTWWFWVLTTIGLQVLVGWRIYQVQKRKELEKRKQEVAKAHLASLEQQAFVSLMNPHFMFNALNSIQHYINTQDRQNANKFLSDFASLIRKNFESAQQAFIPLEVEISNLNLYFSLEKMRFNDRFAYEIRYADTFDPEDWMMPTMILQPLVENALLHGIMPSKRDGVVTIDFSLQENDLLIEVTDNGIGIQNSRASKEGTSHRSRGMELIYKRLHALSFFCVKPLDLVYSIPFSDLSNPGNKISLCIPDELYYAWKKAQKVMNEKLQQES